MLRIPWPFHSILINLVDISGGQSQILDMESLQK